MAVGITLFIKAVDNVLNKLNILDCRYKWYSKQIGITQKINVYYFCNITIDLHNYTANITDMLLFQSNHKFTCPYAVFGDV